MLLLDILFEKTEAAGFMLSMLCRIVQKYHIPHPQPTINNLVIIIKTEMMCSFNHQVDMTIEMVRYLGSLQLCQLYVSYGVARRLGDMRYTVHGCIYDTAVFTFSQIRCMCPS